MTAFPQIYDAADATLLSTTIDLDVEAGDVDGPTTYHLWSDKGGLLGGTTLLDPQLFPICTTHGDACPALIEKWMRAAVTGSSNPGADPTFEDQTTGSQPIGLNAPLILKDIPKNCVRYFTIETDVPAGQDASTHDLQLQVVFELGSVTLPFRLTTISGAGVVHDHRDSGARRLVRGRDVTAAGTATLTIMRGSFVYDGQKLNVLQGTVVLDQNAADGALGVGQEYVAVLSQKSDKTVTTTKSNKGAAPATPATPAGEIFLAKVTVVYQAGGVSVINSGNVDTSLVTRGEYIVLASGGLNVKIGAGFALCATDSQPFEGSSSTIGLTDNATNYVWVRPDGTFSATTTSAAPIAGADLLAIVVTAAGAITTVTDAREFIDHALYDHVITLKQLGNVAAVANDFAWDVAPFDYMIERVVLDIGKKGTSTGAGFKADVLTRPSGTDLGTAGTTIFTNNATDDERPFLAFNAANLHAESIDHEVIYGSKGDRISASIVQVPTGITVNPQDAIVRVLLRRQR